MKRLLVIAGEASGDLLAASVVGELLSNEDDWRVLGVAGPRTIEAGAAPLARAEDISVVGLVEVARSLPRIVGIGRSVLRRAQVDKPSAALLVDLPDFNFRLGPRLAALGVPIVYLGAPQAWAWRPARARKMAGWVNELACLFPFEEPFFQAAGVNARFVGHPRAHGGPPSRSFSDRAHRLVVMPGSRLSEIDRHMPILRPALQEIGQRYPELTITIPVAPTLREDALSSRLDGLMGRVELTHDDALPLLADSQLALVASGTAVTEGLLTATPMVVFYRVASVTAFIARRLITTPWIAMANVLANRELVPELIQEHFNETNVVRRVSQMLDNPTHRQTMSAELATLANSLENPSGRSPAAEVVDMIRSCRLPTA